MLETWDFFKSTAFIYNIFSTIYVAKLEVNIYVYFFKKLIFIQQIFAKLKKW